MNREFVCINCEQSFRVQDALIIDSRSSRKDLLQWIMVGLGAAVVLLLAWNLWSLRTGVQKTAEVSPQTAAAVQTASAQAVPQADLQTVIAPLYRTLNEFRAENEKLAKQITILEQSRQDLAERLEKAEKQLAANAGNERTAAVEESINTLNIKVESANAQLKMLDENHKQLLNGLTKLRTDLYAMNIEERLTNLSKKAEDIDLTPISRRIDRLEALVNAIRTVQ